VELRLLQRQIDLKNSLAINMYSSFHRQQFKEFDLSDRQMRAERKLLSAQ